MPKNIIFVGPMGAGKTTIGRQIAKALGRTFYDSDKEIEKRTGASIPLIFELEQETGFRARESAMLEELLSKNNNIVLATGGGAILSESNRNVMSKHGYIIYLCAPLDQLVRRTARDKNRPLLQTQDPRKTIEDLLEIRDPLYRETADQIFETNNLTVRQVVSKLQKIINSKQL